MPHEPKPPLISRDALAPTSPSALLVDGDRLREAVTTVHAWAGSAAADRTLIFLTATIENPHTRRAYRRAVAHFVGWCESHGLALERVSSPLVAAYLAELGHTLSKPSVKVHLSALNHWFDMLVLGHVLTVNPVHAVRGPRFKKDKGTTPAFEVDELKQLLSSITGGQLAAVRDRALLATLFFSWARISALLGMRVRDYRGAGTASAVFWVQEKGGKLRELPAHHQACVYLDAYVALAGLALQPGAFLWQGLRGRRLSGKPLTQSKACALVKRRCRAAGLTDEFCNHSFRSSGITIFRDRGGDLETARELAGHADVRTTQMYDRSRDRKTRAEVERVQL